MNSENISGLRKWGNGFVENIKGVNTIMETEYDKLLSLIGKNMIDPIRETLLNFLSLIRDQLVVAPASSRYHHDYEGGLVDHILQMYSCFSELRNLSKVDDGVYAITSGSFLLVCILHDINKACDALLNPRYFLAQRKRNKDSYMAPDIECCNDRSVIQIIHAWSLINHHIPDGIASLSLVKSLAPDLYDLLSDSEIQAIQFHDLGWNPQINSVKSINLLTILVHTADMLSSRGYVSQENV